MVRLAKNSQNAWITSANTSPLKKNTNIYKNVFGSVLSSADMILIFPLLDVADVGTNYTNHPQNKIIVIITYQRVFKFKLFDTIQRPWISGNRQNKFIRVYCENSSLRY